MTTKNDSLKIFDYTDPVAYLNAVLQKKQLKNSRFSLRSWAKQLGWVEATSLSQILRNLRPIPPNLIPKIAKSIGLSGEETEYLEAIVGMRYAKDSYIREICFKKVHELALKASYQVEWIEDFKIFQNPVYMVLLQLVDSEDFQYDFEWVQKKLYSSISVKEIQNAYELLIQRGFLFFDQSEKLQLKSQHISSKHDFDSLWVKKFHQASLELASQAIYSQGLDEREFGSYVLSIKRSDLPEIKKQFREFTALMLAKFSTLNGEADSIYHLNLNLFAHTRDLTTEQKCQTEIVQAS